jgi:hypothetical protein
VTNESNHFLERSQGILSHESSHIDVIESSMHFHFFANFLVLDVVECSHPLARASIWSHCSIVAYLSLSSSTFPLCPFFNLKQGKINWASATLFCCTLDHGGPEARGSTWLGLKVGQAKPTPSGQVWELDKIARRVGETKKKLASTLI